MRLRRLVLGGSAALTVVLLIAALRGMGVAGGLGSDGRLEPAPIGPPVAATWEADPFSASVCDVDRFVTHELDHVTEPADQPARLFDSNGSGVAADDLDGDGRVDVVLGNLEGPNRVLWNEGDWRFLAEDLPDTATRAVQLVDVDADGRLDIVTTHRAAGIGVLRNLGSRRFERHPVVGIGRPAYSMSWGDLDGDGDLDLVAGSYDAELDQHLRSSFLFSDGAGIYVYRNEGDRFVGERLAEESQALVTALVDLDLDGALDLVVGNDFAMPDLVWMNDGAGRLRPAEPFRRTSAHTMSLDAGDIDGDGVEELFATDMRSATTDPALLAEWLPLMDTMDELDDPSSPQQIRNVLQVAQPDGTFRDAAERAGVDAAGWAWSGRFGDLDNDADLDLTVVNGMIAAETFAYLDGAEIVEPNLSFANLGDGRFRQVDWGLGARESGRGSILVDLDDDGDLDMVVNNLSTPSTAFENRRCPSGSSIGVSLHHSGSANTSAIGATVTVVGGDRRQVRTVRSGGGYLSGASTLLHVGLGSDAVDRLEVRWPDGRLTVIESPLPDTHYEVTRP